MKREPVSVTDGVTVVPANKGSCEDLQRSSANGAAQPPVPPYSAAETGRCR